MGKGRNIQYFMKLCGSFTIFSRLCSLVASAFPLVVRYGERDGDKKDEEEEVDKPQQLQEEQCNGRTESVGG